MCTNPSPTTRAAGGRTYSLLFCIWCAKTTEGVPPHTGTPWRPAHHIMCSVVAPKGKARTLLSFKKANETTTTHPFVCVRHKCCGLTSYTVFDSILVCTAPHLVRHYNYSRTSGEDSGGVFAPHTNRPFMTHNSTHTVLVVGTAVCFNNDSGTSHPFMPI